MCACPTLSCLTLSSCRAQSGHNVSAEGVNLGPLREAREGNGQSGDSYLLPDDLVHLTRRSLFLVIDSDNSTSFARLQVRARADSATCVRPSVKSVAKEPC
jgi:hypothetical protein